MKIKLSEDNRDYSISIIRLISTSFIITCHIMQYFNIELAWWFNVGVQMFLCMSGFLYGKKNKIYEDIQFYKKNAIKILVDYYVVIIPIILLFAIFHPERLSAIKIIKVLLTYGVLDGGEHLWYIPYCLFCYLITPFLSRYFYNHQNKHIIIRFLLLSFFAVVITETFFSYFNSAWIFCYILGFFLGNISINNKNKSYNKMSYFIIVGAIISNTIQITIDYILKLEFNGLFSSLYLRFCNFAHVALGVSLFIFLKFLFYGIFKSGYSNLIKKVSFVSDKYSYDVYLVHQFVILGPFSLMQITKITSINLTLILSIIAVSAVLVHFISNLIIKKLKAITYI